jgi:metal-dependent amidase/aminoacylase/carboxypeptidase family protein
MRALLLVGLRKYPWCLGLLLFFVSNAVFSVELKKQEKETKEQLDARMAHVAAGCTEMDRKQISIFEEMGGNPKDYKTRNFCQEAYDYMKKKYGSKGTVKRHPKFIDAADTNTSGTNARQ